MRCARCDGELSPEPVKAQEEIVVRAEPIKVDVEYHICSQCSEKYLIPSLDKDPLKAAYERYREKHKMLNANEIKNWRKKHDLTQEQVSGLLGIAAATLSRYESGKLQDEAHEKMLRMAMEPTCLQRLVANSVGVFNDEEKKHVIETIKAEAEEELSLDHWITINLSNYDADEYSGFKKFDMRKFRNAVLYLCRGGTITTKLNKLLFYSDFVHFNQYTVSITGTRYAKVPYGPAPNDFRIYYSSLIKQGSIKINEKIYTNFTGEEMVAVQEPELTVFKDSELKILASVKEHFKQHNASEISSVSHTERGYKVTKQGELISYKYAKDLSLEI
jgi:putative zinc finger/helix-turn-helix YgiT family protein